MQKFIVASFLLVAVAFTYPNNAKQNISHTSWTASWSFDDRYIALGNANGQLDIYETNNWTKIKSFKYDFTTITRVEWNPKSAVLAIAGYAYKGKPSIVQLYDIEQNKVISTLTDSLYGRAVTWSPDGERLAYAGTKGMISIFSKQGKLQKTLSYTNPHSVMEIDWHPTEDILLLVEEDIYLWDITKDSLIATFDDGSKNKGILCCQWHPSGNFFVTGDYGHENEGGEPSYLRFWTKDGKLFRQINDAKYEYRNVRWTVDGKYLAATADILIILNAKGEVESKTKFDNNNLWGVAWNSAGDKIIISDQAGNIRVVKSDGTVLKTFKQ